MTEKGLPAPHRLTYLYGDGVPVGTAFADFADSVDASMVMNALNGGLIDGVRLIVEYKRLLPRVERNRRYREERDRRVWSGGSSSTEAETASATASYSTGEATAISEETGHTSTVEEERVDSVIDDEDEFHSCLSWQSADEERRGEP